jgi:hypothetical protein
MTRRLPPTRLRLARFFWLGVLMALAPVFAAPAGAAARTLYERLAYADLAVHVRVIDGSLRLAECQVLAVLKGTYTGEKVFIGFRGIPDNPGYLGPRATFPDGSETILLLMPSLDTDGGRHGLNRFRLVGGATGKIDLPNEGAPATLDAVRRLAAIQGLTDIHQIWAAQRQLIHENNPYLIEAGFAQILKFRLGNAEMVPTLLEYLDSRDDGFRQAALQVQAQIFRKSQTRGEPLGNEDHVVARLLTVTSEDPTPDVRVAAVQALHAYGRPDVVAALEQVAREDPSQDVRYEATVSAYRLSRGAGDAGTVP